MMIRRLVVASFVLFLALGRSFGGFTSVQTNHGQCLNGAYVGDSLTLGFPISDPYTALIATALGVTSSNQGVGGAGWNKLGNAGIPNLTTRAAAEVDPLLVSLRCSGVYPYPFLILGGGSNDVCDDLDTGAVAFGYFTTYVTARKAAGWAPEQLLAWTIPSRGFGNGTPCTGTGTEPANYNASVIAGASTYGYSVVRFDQDANLGCDSCYLNRTYYQTDNTHLTAAGYAVIANLVCLKMRGDSCPAY